MSSYNYYKKQLLSRLSIVIIITDVCIAYGILNVFKNSAIYCAKLVAAEEIKANGVKFEENRKKIERIEKILKVKMRKNK